MILVTGGAGYVGSHTALALLKRKEKVLIFDNLEVGHLEIVNTLKNYGTVEFVCGDLRNSADINEVFKKYEISSVFHFAAFSQINESVRDPHKYYYNNVEGTLNLLSAMLGYSVKKIVFSSTASVYGEPGAPLIDENHPLRPINPYGSSKLMVEKIITAYNDAYGLKSVHLRYFNVVGADSQARIGEWHEPETHLVPNILCSTFEGGKKFRLFGNDYNTRDGTCIRDYINIEDLAEAHVLALDYLNAGGASEIFNLGTNEGSSVLEVFRTCEEVTQRSIPVQIMPRRAGDPEVLVALNLKAKKILGWQPKRTLEDSIRSAYAWVQAKGEPAEV